MSQNGARRQERSRDRHREDHGRRERRHPGGILIDSCVFKFLQDGPLIAQYLLLLHRPKFHICPCRTSSSGRRTSYAKISGGKSLRKRNRVPNKVQKD